MLSSLPNVVKINTNIKSIYSLTNFLFKFEDLVWLNVTLTTIGKCFASAAFAIAFIYSAELVPTKVRNIAVGTSSMWARVGSMIAPFIVDLLVGCSC